MYCRWSFWNIRMQFSCRQTTLCHEHFIKFENSNISGYYLDGRPKAVHLLSKWPEEERILLSQKQQNLYASPSVNVAAKSIAAIWIYFNYT